MNGRRPVTASAGTSSKMPKKILAIFKAIWRWKKSVNINTLIGRYDYY